jgi:GAF domain-containing protein
MEPLHLLFDHAPEGLLLTAADGRTLVSNPAARALAAVLGVECTLEALLTGAAAATLVARAQHDGIAQTLVPVVRAGARERIVRVTARPAGDGAIAVGLVDVTRELTAYEELVARNHEMAVLRDMGAALSDQHDVAAICGLVYRHTSRLLNTGDFAIYVVDADRHIQVAWQSRGYAPVESLPAPRPWGAGPVECVLETREPLSFARDPAAECEALQLIPDGPLGRSWLGVPMVAGGGALGAIVVQDFERPGRFSAQDVAVLGIVAAQAATAIQTAQLLAGARNAYIELREAQARLLESERLRTVNETVGALSHEINNPLAGISGNAQLLLRQPDLDPHLRTRLERILAAAQRIDQVTTRMANLIQAASMPYPGNTSILDVASSRTRDEAAPPDTDRAA